MNRFPARHQRRNSRGVALIILLAMIVLLTVLVILILTRASLSRQISFSSAGQQKADQLAQGAQQEILNDLRQEIAAGSQTHASNSATYNRQNVYLPNSNQTSVPAFAGCSPTASSDPFPNLLKRSAYGASFFPSSPTYNVSSYPPSNLASQSSTGSPSSIDGRAISSTRWNKPALLDPTQVAGPSFQPPDWILVTRSGPQAFGTWDPTLKDTTNTSNYVVGRYAYMIYDEGGLLDANTAGYATSFSSDFDKSSKRGRLGQADLTALPGLTQSDIDKIVLWRNATTASSAESYFDYLFHGTFTTGLFQYNVTTPADPTAAFTITQNGDQSFLSRQDLLDFFHFTFGSSATENEALPYLGTFSRELNSPSYCPPNPGANANTVLTTPTAPYLYANNAESATLPNLTPNPNRNFPSVKFVNGGTLPDGVTVVKAGDPLVRRRFALSRLQLLANQVAHPGSVSTDLIHTYFGLVYDSSTGKWTYTSPDSNSVATSIKTLDQVAQVSPPREPDFFELLQAGILRGSLGKTTATDLNGNSTSGSETVAYDSRTDFQVIQIGANIMAQALPPNTPTTITYGGTPSDTDPAGFYDFYGIGNLPYISKITQVIYRPEMPGPPPTPPGVTYVGNPYNDNKPWDRPYVTAYLQFELWNPHQNPEAGTALPLRIYAVGSAAVVAFTAANSDGSSANNGGDEWAPWYGNPDPTQPAVAYGGKTFDSGETINVPTSAYAAADYFREPHTLTADLGVTTSTIGDHLQASNIYSGATGWDLIGLQLGYAYAPDGYANETGYPTYDHPPVTGEPMNPQGAGLTSTGFPGATGVKPTFYLQCESPPGSGQWRTIQRIKNCIVPCDTNTPLPSLWLKGLQADESGMVPSHSEVVTQVGGSYPANYIYTDPVTGTKSIEAKSAYRMLPDPRTDRFGVFESYREDPSQPTLVGPSFDETLLPSVLGDKTRGLFGYYWSRGRMRIPNTYSYLAGGGGVPYTANGWVDGCDTASVWGTVPNGAWASLLMFNSPTIPASITQGITAFPFTPYYYADNDGIIRGGDAYYADGGDHDGNGFFDGYSGQMSTVVGHDRPERPVILNRPFRSVGELGYVHRGEPWKSLDFFTPDSADAGLLDLFSIDDEDVVAGTVDLNTRQAPVLQAILQGAAKNEHATSASDSGDPVLSSADAAALAGLLVTERLGTSTQAGPLANRSELVTRFLAQNTASSNYTAFPLNKTRREAVVRPLAAVGNTRTWNLLIDIVAQSGRYPTSANDLSQFQIEGEKRYWWHVAIDRITGQIVDSQLEPVYE